MKRRNRFVAALVALVALTTYVGESVWASSCSPVPAVSTGAGLEQTAPTHAAAHGLAERAGDQGERPIGGAPDCPLGAAAGGASCAAAPLPSATCGLLTTSEPAESPVGLSDARHDRLLLLGLFRPPRA